MVERVQPDLHVGDADKVIRFAREQMNRGFLASGDLVDAITLPPRIEARHMGEVELRGKVKSVSVYAMSRTNDW